VFTAIAGFLATSKASAAPEVTVPPDPSEPPTVPTILETAFDQARRLAVPVFIDNKGPYEFVVDTGSNRSVISTEVADFLRLPEVGTAPVHGILGAQSAPLVKLDRMRTGAVSSSGLHVPKVARSRVGADGILGLDMLHSRRIVLDFHAQTFEISPSAQGPMLGDMDASRLHSSFAPVTVPARFQAGQLVIIDADAAGHDVTAFLDSGSQVTVANLALRDLALTSRPDLRARLIDSELISATGQKAEAQFGALPGLRLGGLRIEAPFVGFADLHIFDLWELRSRPTVLVGVDTLRRFQKVAFDFGRKLITFWPLRSRGFEPSR
jgi:hypothetical protein